MNPVSKDSKHLGGAVRTDCLETQPWDASLVAAPKAKLSEVIDLDTPERVKREPVESALEPPSQLAEAVSAPIPEPIEPEPSQHESPTPKPIEPEPSQHESPIPKLIEPEPSQHESPIPKPIEPEPCQHAAPAIGASSATHSPEPTPKPKPSSLLYADDLTPEKQVQCCKTNQLLENEEKA